MRERIKLVESIYIYINGDDISYDAFIQATYICINESSILSHEWSILEAAFITESLRYNYRYMITINVNVHVMTQDATLEAENVLVQRNIHVRIFRNPPLLDEKQLQVLHSRIWAH